MKTRGAILNQSPGEWEVVELDLEEPRQNELLLKMAASGLCHSDDHIAKGDSGVKDFPFAGGHEGSAVVAAVGPHGDLRCFQPEQRHPLDAGNVPPW